MGGLDRLVQWKSQEDPDIIQMSKDCWRKCRFWSNFAKYLMVITVNPLELHCVNLVNRFQPNFIRAEIETLKWKTIQRSRGLTLTRSERLEANPEFWRWYIAMPMTVSGSWTSCSTDLINLIRLIVVDVPRMSFYTPLNPVLQRELGSISADRASVFPGVFEGFDELIEAHDTDTVC